MKNHLPEAVSLDGYVLDVLDQDIVPPQPSVHFRDELLERPPALDASANRVVQLGLAGERLDQRMGLPGHQTVVVRHGYELVPPQLLLHSLERRRNE